MAAEIPRARIIELPRTGHEIFPREQWDTVIPAILGAGTLLAEAFVASEALGALLERTDVSAIDPLDA